MAGARITTCVCTWLSYSQCDRKGNTSWGIDWRTVSFYSEPWGVKQVTPHSLAISGTRVTAIDCCCRCFRCCFRFLRCSRWANCCPAVARSLLWSASDASKSLPSRLPKTRCRRPATGKNTIINWCQIRISPHFTSWMEVELTRATDA